MKIEEKSRIEEIENNAYLIMSNIAFGYISTATDDNKENREIIAINLKDTNQTITFRLKSYNKLEMKNMSDYCRLDTIYKVVNIMLINERFLIDGLSEWEPNII